MRVNQKENTLRKITFAAFGTASALLLILSESLPVSARTENLLSMNDVGSHELRAITIESWDRDYSGGGYGWRVSTNKDKKEKNTPQAQAYKSLLASVQAEREVKLVAGTPLDIRENQGYPQAQVLGVRFAFTFPGDNVVSISPPKADQYTIERIRHYLSESAAVGEAQPTAKKSCYTNENLSILRNASERAFVVECVNGVDMPGIVREVSVWVMGRGNPYELEVLLEDWQGSLHVLKMGSINFIGWRPLRVKIPKHIPQEVDTFPQTKTLVLRKLKLRSTVKSTVNNYVEEPVYIFFDELRILSESFQHNFDGAQLDFDQVDCERKNHLFRKLRANSRVPEQWPKLVDCSQAGKAAPGGGGAQ